MFICRTDCDNHVKYKRFMLGMANMQVGLLLVFFFEKSENGQFKMSVLKNPG